MQFLFNVSNNCKLRSRPVARLCIEGGRDIFQVGPDMFVTLSKRFSKIF